MPEINNGPLPEELKNWNWAAFLLTWIWAIGHNVWIGLLALIPGVHLAMMIVLGLKGNEWAWNAKQFKNVAEYKATQKSWTIAGAVVVAVSIPLSLVIIAAIFGIYAMTSSKPMVP